MPSTPGPGSYEDLDMDHEKYAGEEIPDPWDDEDQDDWPQNPVNMVEEVENGSDTSTDDRTDDLSE